MQSYINNETQLETSTKFIMLVEKQFIFRGDFIIPILLEQTLLICCKKIQLSKTTC